MEEVIFILYVREQEASKKFYEKVLNVKPGLDVPGMTEFRLTGSSKLGLMPEAGIKKLLGDNIFPRERDTEIPGCELYMYVEEPDKYLARLPEAGGRILSPVEKRNWGDDAGYGIDIDGHVIAFAKKGD